MIDLIYLTHNRLEFTKASVAAMLQNTDWSRVNRCIFYDDSSTDGTFDYLAQQQFSDRWSHRWELVSGKWNNPVAVMLDYLRRPRTAEVFAKIDNDVILPPGWLEACTEVMDTYSVELLGIEPPQSRRTPGPTAAGELQKGDPRWVSCDSIGGIGLMRRSAFERFPDLAAHGTYGGFTEWQLRHGRHDDLQRGWIAPALKVFLLDRLPIEPWASLSQEYIRSGWQRPWQDYTLDKSELWEWWAGAQSTSA